VQYLDPELVHGLNQRSLVQGRHVLVAQRVIHLIWKGSRPPWHCWPTHCLMSRTLASMLHIPAHSSPRTLHMAPSSSACIASKSSLVATLSIAYVLRARKPTVRLHDYKDKPRADLL
jgi:hypothetical protein